MLAGAGRCCSFFTARHSTDWHLSWQTCVASAGGAYARGVADLGAEMGEGAAHQAAPARHPLAQS
eukprot:10172528-Alexandrium_andersonii.AAC.1